MTGADAQAGPIAGLDTSVAHPARVYDYWLGGKDNFAADREAAERVLAVTPGLRFRVRANRAFLGRATRFLAADAGVRQFLDIGTGIPAGAGTGSGSPVAAGPRGLRPGRGRLRARGGGAQARRLAGTAVQSLVDGPSCLLLLVWRSIYLAQGWAARGS